MMKRSYRAVFMGWLAVVGTAFGCAEQGSAEAVGIAEPTGTAVLESAELKIERAVRDIESGQNLDAARAQLDAVLADPAVSPDLRDDARLALSRLHEIRGEDEQAIVAIEQLLASHRLDAKYAAHQAAERRLRFLLTGSEDSLPRSEARDVIPPIAHRLAGFFTPDSQGTTHVGILIFGRAPETGEPTGAFNIAEALQARKQESCPLCTDGVSVSTSRSQTSSWVMLPAAAAAAPSEGPTYANALTVFYFDLETNRIPSRYDSYLPMRSDDVVARLEKGEGVVAVKVRDGAPPVVLLAAPRWGLLSDVEQAFSKLEELPAEPQSVSVDPKLRSDEIRAVVRGGYPKLRKCYEDLLATDPDARGKVVLGFAIENGSAVDVEVDAQSTLTDAALQSCFLGAFRSLRFPAAPGRVTVKYPIALSPDK